MKIKLDSVGSKARNITAIILLVLLVSGGAASYFAKASDLKSLHAVVITSQIAEYEEMINDVEDDIAVLEAMPSLSEAEKLHLSRLKSRRERYIRSLSDIRESN